MPLKKPASVKTVPGEIRGKKKKVEAVPDMVVVGEEIQLQAYYNYLKRVRGNTPGTEVSDWLDAERAVKGRAGTR